MSLTACSSDARPINLVRGAGIEGTDPNGPLGSCRSSCPRTPEFWHHVIAFPPLLDLPMRVLLSPPWATAGVCATWAILPAPITPRVIIPPVSPDVHILITYATVRDLVVGRGDFGSAFAKSAARRVSR
jgi:hypothetical protein